MLIKDDFQRFSIYFCEVPRVCCGYEVGNGIFCTGPRSFHLLIYILKNIKLTCTNRSIRSDFNHTIIIINVNVIGGSVANPYQL